MKILLINKFFFLKGGAEAYFFDASKLLADNGHKVVFFSMEHPENFDSPYSEYFVSNIDFEDKSSFLRKIKAAGRIIYSLESQKKLEELLEKEEPDLAHLNNIYHQISPSILHTLKKHNLPLVMTLHDYKLVCPVYTMLSRGAICEKCNGSKYYHCLLNKCCKDSYLKSFWNAFEMHFHHSILHIYDLVDLFISPSIFLKNKIANMGFGDRHKVIHLPNFLNTNDFIPNYNWDTNSIVYFGRLSPEKGIFTLLSAVKGLGIKCKIIGNGPERMHLERKAKDLINVRFLGYKLGGDLYNEIKKSMFVVVPSECYENYPRSIIEAFALGKPVVASRIGGIPELVKDNHTGLTFKPGNPDALREKILYMLNNADKIIEMGKNGRRLIEEELNQKRYYEALMKIYQSLIENK